MTCIVIWHDLQHGPAVLRWDGQERERRAMSTSGASDMSATVLPWGFTLAGKKRRFGARTTPLADANSRLAAIEHRQSQLKEQAAMASGKSDSEVHAGAKLDRAGSHSHHTADTILTGTVHYLS